MPGSGYATISRKKILEFLKKNSDRTVAEDKQCGGGGESHDAGRKGVYGDR